MSRIRAVTAPRLGCAFKRRSGLPGSKVHTGLLALRTEPWSRGGLFLMRPLGCRRTAADSSASAPGRGWSRFLFLKYGSAFAASPAAQERIAT